MLTLHRVKYSELAAALQAASETKSRLEQTAIMCKLFRKVIKFCPKDLTKCVYLATNSVRGLENDFLLNSQLAPPYMGIELGVGESLITKAISEATGKSKAAVTSQYQNLGDLGTRVYFFVANVLGLVAEASVCNLRTLVPPKPLTVARVHQQFLEIAKISGNAVRSQNSCES